MLSVNEIQKRLVDANIKKVALKSGVEPQTVYRLMNGYDVRVSSVEKLSAYLESLDSITGCK